MAGLRDVSVSLKSKTVRSIRLAELLVAQLCTYSMLSALCFAYPLYLFDCSGSSTLYGVVVAIAFIPGVLAAPVGGILADRGRHREVLVALGIALMTASLLSIPMKRSLPLAVVVVAILCVQYGVQSLLKPMLQIETVRMAGEKKVERATALVSQVTMVSNSWVLWSGRQSMGALASMLFAQPRRWRLRFQLSCLGSHSSKMPHLKRWETARLARHAETIFGSRFGICCKMHHWSL